MLAMSAAMTLVGCTGSSTDASGPVATAARLVTIPQGVAVLGHRASGESLVMRRGDKRAIQLSRKPIPAGIGNWRRLTATRAGVVAVRQSGGYPRQALLTALIFARRPGSTELVATSDAKCFHSKLYMCHQPQITWRITVTVRK